MGFTKAVLLLWFLTVYLYFGSPIMWVTYLGSWMTTCMEKSCSFGLPRVHFVNCCQFMYLVISLLVLRTGYGIWLYQFLIIAYLFTLHTTVNNCSSLLPLRGSNRYFRVCLYSHCASNIFAKDKSLLIGLSVKQQYYFWYITNITYVANVKYNITNAVNAHNFF